jgi:hypothetical protein
MIYAKDSLTGLVLILMLIEIVALDEQNKIGLETDEWISKRIDIIWNYIKRRANKQ